MPRAKRTPPPPGLVKISKLAALSGVPSSTIKHYVRLGLLPPPVTRPNKQMAYYDEACVDRIRAIKILQQEKFLPLPTIKRLLGEPPARGEQRGEALRAKELAALEPALRPPATGWMAKKAIVDDWHLSAKELAGLEAARLIAPTPGEDGAAGYADADLELLRVIHETRAAGLEHVFPMDILAPYVEAVKRLVQIEVELFRTRLAAGVPLPPGRTLAEVATLATRLGERMVVVLRQKLTIGELRRVSAEAEPTAPGAAAAAPAKKPRKARARAK